MPVQGNVFRLSVALLVTFSGYLPTIAMHLPAIAEQACTQATRCAWRWQAGAGT